jgi:hypothetical protein
MAGKHPAVTTANSSQYFEPMVPAVRPNGGNFLFRGEFRLKLEFSMQAAVDRVMRAFTLKHPIPDEEAEAIRKEVSAFATELLEKYKDQLARRTLSGAER